MVRLWRRRCLGQLLPRAPPWLSHPPRTPSMRSPSNPRLPATAAPAGTLDSPLLRGACSIEDGAFTVRGVPAAVALADAKHASGTEYLNCDLTGDFNARPFAYNFTDVRGAPRPLAPSSPPGAPASLSPLAA